MLAEINGCYVSGPESRQPLSAYTELQGRRVDGLRLLDLHRGVRRRDQPGRPPGAARRDPARCSPSGAGPGRPTGGCSTTGPRPTPTASRGASARSTSGGTRARASWVGDDVPDFPVDRAPHTRPDPDARRSGGARRRRRVHHAGRRQGLAVRAEGPGRRPAADALRAAGVSGAQHAVPAAAEPGPGHVPPHGQPGRAERRACRAWRSIPTCSPPTG